MYFVSLYPCTLNKAAFDEKLWLSLLLQENYIMKKKNEKKSLRKNGDTIGIEMYKPNNNYNAYNKA